MTKTSRLRGRIGSIAPGLIAATSRRTHLCRAAEDAHAPGCPRTLVAGAPLIWTVTPGGMAKQAYSPRCSPAPEALHGDYPARRFASEVVRDGRAFDLLECGHLAPKLGACGTGYQRCMTCYVTGRIT